MEVAIVVRCWNIYCCYINSAARALMCIKKEHMTLNIRNWSSELHDAVLLKLFWGIARVSIFAPPLRTMWYCQLGGLYFQLWLFCGGCFCCVMQDEPILSGWIFTPSFCVCKLLNPILSTNFLVCCRSIWDLGQRSPSVIISVTHLQLNMYFFWKLSDIIRSCNELNGPIRVWIPLKWRLSRALLKCCWSVLQQQL